MYRLLLVSATLALVSGPIGSWAQLPNGQCTAEDVTCRIEDDNLVGTANGVADLSECSDIAGEGDYLTYFGSAGFPFVDSCLYFSSCQTLVECDDCTTRAPTTCRTPICSASIQGPLSSNLITVIDNVDSEEECDSSCVLEDQCAVYTFYRSNDSTYPSTCFLLTELGLPIRECEGETCVTGLPNCEGSICAFLDGAVTYPQGILVTKEDKNIELLTLGACPSPVAIAIGGGGRGNNYGGGGSGYVEYQIGPNWPQKAYLKVAVHPGSESEDSYVSDISDSTDIVRGGRGQDGGGDDGGAGYSGGGGYCYPPVGGAGGSNGSKGEDGCIGVGGAGSGVQIDNIPLTNFDLSPGEGGRASGASGGGGGGVLINMQGPDRPTDNMGEGYGGGGNYYNDDSGLPGAVILDFAPDE